MSNSHMSTAPEVSYQTVTVDGIEIFYREAGPEDAPIILLLHGLPSSSRMYQQLLESKLSSKFRMIAPDYPGFGHSSWPDPKDFAYTFDHLAFTMERFCEEVNLDRYTLFMQDYGGPVGFRMAVNHPGKISAMIIQNAVAHEQGLSPLWEVRRAFWNDRSSHEEGVRKNLLSLEATRQRHVGSDPNPSRYNPDLWMDEFYFLNRPGQSDIQIDLFCDYQNNVRSYPAWQRWLREHKPPLLVVWGRFDPSFTVAGAEAYKTDVPGAEVHILDAGHFALDTRAAEIIEIADTFLHRQKL
ncbi:MAG: alpha/beta hydrolase [Cyanobacteria bacterium SZAS TMP-1]|nr:alpha/beta hydrolase [Cyanobacteria bacterium SZAS TMP-1]